MGTAHPRRFVEWFATLWRPHHRSRRHRAERVDRSLTADGTQWTRGGDSVLTAAAPLLVRPHRIGPRASRDLADAVELGDSAQRWGIREAFNMWHATGRHALVPKLSYRRWRTGPRRQPALALTNQPQLTPRSLPSQNGARRSFLSTFIAPDNGKGSARN